jgi:hypothetical protein
LLNSAISGVWLLKEPVVLEGCDGGGLGVAEGAGEGRFGRMFFFLGDFFLEGVEHLTDEI